MKRRAFIKNTTLAAAASVYITRDLFAKDENVIYGHNNMKYSLDMQWCKANPMKNPVNDCHEMVQDAKGRIILLTNETKNNIMMFNTSGKLIDYWGESFPGGHGLTLSGDTLFVTDTVKHQVYKTTLDG
jgi:hypothetical protein